MLAPQVLLLLRQSDGGRADLCRMGAAGQRQARHMFGSERTRSKYLALYSCLAGCASVLDHACAENCVAD